MKTRSFTLAGAALLLAFGASFASKAFAPVAGKVYVLKSNVWQCVNVTGNCSQTAGNACKITINSTIQTPLIPSSGACADTGTVVLNGSSTATAGTITDATITAARSL